LRHGPTVQTKMSLATAGIYYTISPPLSGAMEDCSIVCVQQPKRSVAKGAECPRHDACSAQSINQSIKDFLRWPK